MKHVYILSASLLLISNLASAANKYWVGPDYGNWSVAANWSLTSGGTGGAGVPGLADDIQFNGVAKIVMNTSATVNSINTSFGFGKVTLVANASISISIIGSLNIGPLSYILDSTTTNLPFNVLFKTNSTANILGVWIFSGAVPVTGTGGASFNAPSGTLVTVSAMPGASSVGGRIVCRSNSKPISSTAATLKFDNNSSFVSENVKEAKIPYALWARDSIGSFLGSSYADPAAVILLSGSFDHITHTASVPNYASITIDLSTLENDVNLGLPDGCKVAGNLKILNTNNHTVVLLAATSATSSVGVQLGTTGTGYYAAGNLTISGSNTKVALAKATAAAPSTAYKLLVQEDFIQTGGNFSLQDYDLATGSSTLDIKDNFNETAGTFITNSTSTSPLAKFRVIMDDPTYYTGPSGDFQSGRTMNVSSGTIDNGRKMVILRIDHTAYNLPGFTSDLNGVILQTPLVVGRLELVRSPLTTSTTNMLTVSSPDPAAITTVSSNSYVNGPLRRATNSTQPYLFPTGDGNSAAYGYHYDSCIITPAATTASLYQSQYYNTGNSVTAVTAPLQGVSTNKNFYILRISGADAMVTLCLNGAVTGAGSSKGIVVAYVGPTGNWIKENGTIITPGNVKTGSVTTGIMSTFGYFTFGYGVPSGLLTAFTNGPLAYSSNEQHISSVADVVATTTIYPNPFIDNLTIDFYNAGSAAANAVISIYDLKGGLVYSQRINNVATGRNTAHVNMSGRNMRASIYTAQLSINGVVMKTVKLMKQ